MSCSGENSPATVIHSSSAAPQVPDAYRQLDLHIEDRPLATIKSYDRNARTHSKKQINQIAESIRTFGFVAPVLVNRDGTLIAGHGRVAAAKKLGYSSIPVIVLDHLTEAQQRALRLADNKLAELAGWNDDFLAAEFEFLTTEVAIDFEMTVTGFENAEIDGLITGLSADTSQEAPYCPPETADESVSRLGDIFQLDDSRIACGNSTDPEVCEAVMAGERAALSCNDGPYNVRINGHVSSSGKHGEFVQGAGELTIEQFTAFNAAYLTNCHRYSHPSALHYAFMDWRHMQEMLGGAERAGLEPKQLCVWNKGAGGMGSFYRSQHELVFVFGQPGVRHMNNVQLGKFGRNRTNVWTYPGAPRLRKELEFHPTPKPVALIADIIRDASARNDIVLDAFSGSGTTIIAAASTGRRARVIELDPHYVDVAIRRWEEWSGGVARHVATGLTFAELAERRRQQASTSQSDERPVARVRRRTSTAGGE